MQKDHKGAFPYALKACERGNMAGCVNVAQMYRRGEGVPKDEEKAKAYELIATEMMRQLVEHREQLKFQGDADK